MIRGMRDVICLCNGVWEDDLIEYLKTYPVASIEELRSKERICNNCRQCEPLIQDLIARYRKDGSE
jgi:bacterioferritin-associated ferredoxin